MLSLGQSGCTIIQLLSVFYDSSHASDWCSVDSNTVLTRKIKVDSESGEAAGDGFCDL